MRFGRYIFCWLIAQEMDHDPTTIYTSLDGCRIAKDGEGVKMPPAKSTQLTISSIRVDKRAQARAHIDPMIVDEYAALMQDGVTFPPITVFRNGSSGSGRRAAWRQARWAVMTRDETTSPLFRSGREGKMAAANQPSKDPSLR